MGNYTYILIISLALAMVIGLSEAFDYEEKELENEESLWSLYERWRSHHTVSRDLDEKQKRFNVFKENAKHVRKVNKMDKPYKLTLNKFADLTTHEFQTLYAGSKIRHNKMVQDPRSNTGGGFKYANVSDVPASVDWRKKGAVTNVKHQGNCSSCWAFSVIATVEGISHIRTGKLVPLSEQELVDCDTFPNQGCNGGLMEFAYEFIERIGGITTEANYPYTGTGGPCNMTKVNAPAVSIDGHENVPQNDEGALLKAVANQPVVVSIDSNNQDYQLYSEGVFDGECGTQLSHGVVAVGYGTTVDGTKYWILKNSYGVDWGEKGYIRFQRDVSAKEGQCGIAIYASYPIKNSSDNPPFSNEDHL
ncbi:hypothetical protein RND81_04G110500 [Saponaria officinalis]|uniref:Uncharacterized protein n=1 Tax=Saponaria officinalis TaxID=3572 RepID=A0AAW1LK25_SAPOF